MKKLTTVLPTLSIVSALTLTLLVGTASAASPTGFWQCRAGRRQNMLLVILPNGRLSLEGTPTAYRVSGNTLQVVYGGRWLRLPFQRSGNRLSVTMPTGVRMSCAALQGQSPSRLRGSFCSWSGGSSYYGRTASGRTHRVTFDGRGGFTDNSEATFSGPGTGYYRRSGYKGGFYRIVGRKIIVVRANGAAAVAQVHHTYGGRITEVKYRGKLYGGANCK